MSGIKDILVNICKKGDAPVATKEEMGEGLFRDVDTMLVDQVFYEKDAFVPIVLELPPTIIAKITWSPYTECVLLIVFRPRASKTSLPQYLSLPSYVLPGASSRSVAAARKPATKGSRRWDGIKFR
jgi:hypothetical protein